MDAELDLLPGQLNVKDKSPADYSTPQGNFVGQGYRLDGDVVKPIYKKASNSTHFFIQPDGFKFDDDFRETLREFLFSQHPVIVYPQRIGQHVIVGLNHKLTKIEEANNMLAFRNTEFIPLDDIDVKRIIMEQFQKLNGSGLYQKTTVGNVLPLTPLEVQDKQTGIFVVSFKNGITNDTIQKIYYVDVNTAIRKVQKLVKVPLNKNQIMALVSLAFEISEKDLHRSKLLNVLNAGKYDQVVSYFMDFSERRLNDGRIAIDQTIYNRRLNEAELFSTFI